MKTNLKHSKQFAYLIIALLIVSAKLFAQEVPIFLLRTLSLNGQVYSIAISPNGKLLGSASWDNITLWDIQNGNKVWQIKGDLDATYRAFYHAICIAFNPDGQTIASAGGDEVATIWDVRSGRKIRTFEGNSGLDIESLSYSPDGNILALGRSNGIGKYSIELWDVQTGHQLQTINFKIYYINASCIAISPDGKTIAGVIFDSKYIIKLWDIRTGRELQSLGRQYSHPYCLSFSPDGKKIAAGCDPEIILWDIQSASVLQILKGHSREVRSVAFSPDGKTLFSGSDDSKINFWDVQTGRKLRTLTEHTSAVYSVAISPDGRILASGSNDQTIKLWDISLLDPELAKIYFANQNEKRIELQNIRQLLKPKDEFETDAEFNARINKGKAEQQAIEKKYALKYERLKKEYDEQKLAQSKQKALEIDAQIRNSLSEATLRISSIGPYDANKETFPITINEENKEIKIPRAEARSFKENWQQAEVKGMRQLKKDLTTYEYFNLAIIHPITGNRYPFGEQRDIGQLTTTPTTASSSGAKAVVPPALTLKARLVETSGNGFLDAEEKGKIIVDIANSGKGSAYSVILDLKSEMVDPNITFSRTRIAGEILAGQSKTVEFEIEAGKLVKRQIQNFVITATESNGFAPDPIKISFETYPLVLPELSLVDYGVTTTSGDNVIRPGEVVTIKARVQNIGEGKAKNVGFTVNLPANVFFAPESQQRFQVLELSPGAFYDLPFAILTNNQVAKQVNLTIGMTETYTQKSFTLPLEIDKPLQSMQEFVIRGKEREKTIIENVATLSVDIAKDIPITYTKNPEAYAVVIGNRDYLKVKNVDFAINDATLVKEYLIKTFGFRDENIFFIKNATKADFELCFGTKGNPRGKLFNNIRPDVTSDVVVYYSGHGSPDVNDQKGYFVPIDADPQYIGVSGYSLDLLYENLAQLPAKSITVILDACFSGSGLLEQISPVRIRFTNALMGIKNGVVISSSTGDQVSSWYPEKRHGMFTYFFLKAIHNKNADVNKDGLLTVEEIYNFISDANEGVPRFARKINNVEQNPAIIGDKSRILVRY